MITFLKLYICFWIAIYSIVIWRFYLYRNEFSQIKKVTTSIKIYNTIILSLISLIPILHLSYLYLAICSEKTFLDNIHISVENIRKEEM